jgi:SAM-dependent methyltransferase
VTPRELLGFAVPYRLFGRLIRGKAWKTYLDDYVQPKAGDRVLDLGCGPADILQMLPAVDYMGIDLSNHYIESARRRFGDRAHFICADACTIELSSWAGNCDIVLATGVIHHLNDSEAGQLIDVAYAALALGGRLVTFDGCRTPKQAQIVKWVLNNDRGRFVRQQHEYECLARTRFREVKSHIRHDLLRIPYTHCIMTCQKR